MQETQPLESNGGHQVLPWILAGISGLIMALFCPPLTIPDSLELIAEGGCMLGLQDWSPACEALNPAYWTPGWSIPVGVLGLVLSPLAAAGVVSLLSVALLVVPCWSLGRRLGDEWSGMAGAILVLATPALQTYGMLADGRGMALLCLFSSWALALRALDSDRSFHWAMAAGVVAGVGVLVRPEGLLTLLLIPVFLGLSTRNWRTSLASLGGGLVLAGPWWAILSAHRGRLSFTPRDWEATGFPLLDILPKREVLELYGMGAQDTPFRGLALETDARPSGVGLDLVGGVEWLGTHLPHALPWWGLIAAAGGIVLAFRSGRGRVIVALLFAALPSMIAAFKPQSRDVLLPMANFLPLVVCTWLLGGLSLVWLSNWAIQRLRLPERSQLPAIGAAAVLVWFFGPRVDLMPSTELLSPGREASAWLRDQGSLRIRSSFESAPVVHMAGQRWDPWPSRWDPEAWTNSDRLPDLVLLTDLDDYASPSDGPAMTPVAYYGDDRSWVLLLALDRP